LSNPSVYWPTFAGQIYWFPIPPLGTTPAGAVVTSTPASALLPGTFTPVNTTTGQVTLTMPLGQGATLPLEGMMIGVGDYAGASASVAPIVMLAQGTGTTMADPSKPGSFAALVKIAQQGQVVWWRYFATPNQWIAVFW
jgi:hypothetical protein